MAAAAAALRIFSPAAAAGGSSPRFSSGSSSAVSAGGNRLSKMIIFRRSSASFVSFPVGASTRNTRTLISKHLKKRAEVITCATTEEINAFKSEVEDDIKSRMDKTIEKMQNSFNAIRTGRANPAMLDRIEVEYYGNPISLKSIAHVTTPDASSLLIQPYDKSSIKIIEKAISKSDLDLMPSSDGEVIRVSIPQLTADRRKELSKIVAKLAEEGKVAIRNIRKDGMKAYDKLEKEKKLSEDNVRDLKDDMQKLTDDYVKKIDTILKQKEKELLTV